MTKPKDDQSPGQSPGQSMWGGRFTARPDQVMEAINASIDVDKRLAEEDIAGSRAHAAMLAKQGVISAQDLAAITRGLNEVLQEIRGGNFRFSKALEDIHMNVESRLKEIIGEPAGRLHTARSRNDQIALDFRLWVKSACGARAEQIRGLQQALLAQAEANADTVMPGFTHLQVAQPVTFGHHLLAYVEMLERDRSRFLDALARMNESPLGAAALAGTGFPIDRKMTADALGFARPMANSIDAVSARDFALEALSAVAICAQHLSRLAEEIVVWSSAQFNFVRLSDGWSTGSSIMPQKRNPDAAELVRAKSGKAIGALVHLFTIMKGLPLAYSKDMQDDKATTFDAFDALDLSLQAMTGMIGTLEANARAMHKAASHGFSTATDFADWLVRELHIPFRDAHHITGAAVKYAEQNSLAISEIPLATLKELEPRIDDRIYAVLTVEASVASRQSYGGTSPVRVAEQIAAWKGRLG